MPVPSRRQGLRIGIGDRSGMTFGFAHSVEAAPNRNSAS